MAILPLHGLMLISQMRHTLSSGGQGEGTLGMGLDGLVTKPPDHLFTADKGRDLICGMWIEEAAEVHLEQAVLGRYKPLCHDGIREVLGINVGHPLLIPEDIDRIL